EEVDQPGRVAHLAIGEERREEAVQSGRFEIPVDGEDAQAVAGENPGDVGQRERTPDAALVRVEGDDAAGRWIGHDGLSLIGGGTTIGRVTASRMASARISTSIRLMVATSLSSSFDAGTARPAAIMLGSVARSRACIATDEDSSQCSQITIARNS